MSNILIVEDESLSALELSSNLQNSGFNVIGPYASGEEVIADITNGKIQNIDLALLDIKLKGNTNGIDLGEYLLKRFKNRIPIIYLSAYIDVNGDVISAQINNHKEASIFQVSKPYKFNNLVKVIDQAMSTDVCVKNIQFINDLQTRVNKIESILEKLKITNEEDIDTHICDHSYIQSMRQTMSEVKKSFTDNLIKSIITLLMSALGFGIAYMILKMSN